MSASFDGVLGLLTFASALGCGLIGGVFFAFSAFVMPGLARLPAAQGIAAMRSINLAAITPSFMVALFGTAAGCLLLTGGSLLSWAAPVSWYVVVGSLLYLLGSILVTILFNVPRNDALAAGDPASGDGAAVWAGYLASWTAWNHVRAAAAIAAAALLTVAFRLSRPAIAP